MRKADSVLYRLAKKAVMKVETEPSPKEKKNNTPNIVPLMPSGVINPASEFKAG